MTGRKTQVDDPAQVRKLLQIFKHGESSGEADGEAELRVGADGLRQLNRLPAGELLNLVMICGRAREGKSFLMNILTGTDGLFEVRPTNEPCTMGTDMSPHFAKLADVCGAPIRGSVGWLDTEGHGDKGVCYDVQLAAPGLLLSKVGHVVNQHAGPAADPLRTADTPWLHLN